MITVRRMEKFEIEKVADLEKNCFLEPWNADMILDAVENTDYEFYVCTVENEDIVGYFSILNGLFDTELLRIAVDKSCRGNGYASKMMERLLEVSKEKGAEKVLLEVRESNNKARSLYEKYGFEVCGKRPKYYGGVEDAVLYTLEL